MVIRGNTRGNGKQLAQYLVAMNENERIHILDVDGRENATSEYLQQMIASMDVMADLTKSQKGLYHAQINPAYSEDKNMDWFKAADMLGKELGFEDQRRVIVLHEKKGRAHAHVVWERYDHETGILKSDSFSRLAQDRARKNMEVEFGHKQTPHRNKHRPELKASLTQLWHQTGTGAQFIYACKNNGYMIAQGSGRNPFMVVDEQGRSFDLVRQLKDIRLKDVRSRLRNETLMTEKSAIIFMRSKAERDTGGREKEKAKFNRSALEMTGNPIKQQAIANAAKTEQENAPKTTIGDLAAAKDSITTLPAPPEQQKKTAAKEFTENKQDKVLTEKERLRQAFAKERQEKLEQKRDIDMDFGFE